MPKCKYHKTKFKAKHFNQTHCLEGDECTAAFVEYANEQRRKSWRREKRQKLPELYPRKYRGLFQDEINKLARMIDNELGYHACIDCGETLIGIPQVDGSHFKNVGSNLSVRYNLHNIHSSKSDCNQYHGGKKLGYREGITKRYSKAYLDRMDGLGLIYKDIKLTNKEIGEKLKIVRKLIREFETFNIQDGIKARDLFNKIIGIYK